MDVIDSTQTAILAYEVAKSARHLSYVFRNLNPDEDIRLLSEILKLLPRLRTITTIEGSKKEIDVSALSTYSRDHLIHTRRKSKFQGSLIDGISALRIMSAARNRATLRRHGLVFHAKGIARQAPVFPEARSLFNGALVYRSFMNFRNLQELDLRFEHSADDHHRLNGMDWPNSLRTTPTLRILRFSFTDSAPNCHGHSFLFAILANAGTIFPVLEHISLDSMICCIDGFFSFLDNHRARLQFLHIKNITFTTLDGRVVCIVDLLDAIHDATELQSIALDGSLHATSGQMCFFTRQEPGKIFGDSLLANLELWIVDQKQGHDTNPLKWLRLRDGGYYKAPGADENDWSFKTGHAAIEKSWARWTTSGLGRH